MITFTFFYKNEFICYEGRIREDVLILGGKFLGSGYQCSLIDLYLYRCINIDVSIVALFIN